MSAASFAMLLNSIEKKYNFKPFDILSLFELGRDTVFPPHFKLGDYKTCSHTNRSMHSWDVFFLNVQLHERDCMLFKTYMYQMKRW